MTRTEAAFGVKMADREMNRGGEILLNTQARSNWSSSSTKLEVTGSSQPVHAKDVVSMSLEGDDGPRTVKIFSCWCGENFTTMGSYAKHVNLHARGEYKHAEVDEMKQENPRGSAGLSSNEKENRSEKERVLIAQRLAERSVVDIDQKLEAAAKSS